jgi:hypothetical protein
MPPAGRPPDVTQSDATGERTATVGATGRAEGLPDRASVAFRVQGVDEAVGVARQRATDAATALFDVLAREGVPEEAVGTRRFSVDERDPDAPGATDRAGTDPDAPTEYVARQFVGYRTTDLDGLDVVVTAAVDDAGAGVERVSFGFQESTRRALREAALADAMASARRQATTLADAEGLTVDRALSVEADESRGGAERGLAVDTGRGRSPVDLSPERETLTARVKVVYALETAENPGGFDGGNGDGDGGDGGVVDD